METISLQERASLDHLESRIEHGLKSFLQVGEALAMIRDGRLYRAEYGTFEDYCEQRWGFGANYANKQIAAAHVVSALGTTVPKPANEAQVRPLTKLDAETQRAVWNAAVLVDPEGPTAATVADLVSKAIDGMSEDEAPADKGPARPLGLDALILSVGRCVARLEYLANLLPADKAATLRAQIPALRTMMNAWGPWRWQEGPTTFSPDGRTPEDHQADRDHRNANGGREKDAARKRRAWRAAHPK